MDCSSSLPGVSQARIRSGFPFPSPGYLPDPWIEPMSLASPATAGGFFTNYTTWEILELWWMLAKKIKKVTVRMDHVWLCVLITQIIQILFIFLMLWQFGALLTQEGWRLLSSVQFISVTQSCPTLWDPTNHSTPGLPVHHHLPEFTQTHVHWVRDAIQPSHSLPSPSPPAPNPSQH